MTYYYALSEVSGIYLDNLAASIGIKRRPGESDEDLRKGALTAYKKIISEKRNENDEVEE